MRIFDPSTGKMVEFAMTRCAHCAQYTTTRKTFFNPSMKQDETRYVCSWKCESALVVRYRSMEQWLARSVS